MSHWLRHALPWTMLLVAWVLLNDGLSPGTLLLGAVVAFFAFQMLLRLDLQPMRLRRPRAMANLMLVVLVEVVRSNRAVATIILSPTRRDRRAGFVRIPLDTRNPYCLTGLACIITATPGTLWVQYDSGDSSLLIHVLDLIDEEEWVKIVKTRFERRLMEVFE